MRGRNYKLINKDLDYVTSPKQLIDLIAKRRGLYLDYNYRGNLKDIDIAIERIIFAKDRNEKVKIIGDYDVDGVVSTYILVRSLKDFGIDVDYRIPERLTEGYGVNSTMLKEELNKGVNLCITCDNGIASDAFEEVNKLGIDFIVTDHHKTVKDKDGQDILPKGVLAIVNPKRQDCSYGSKDICGAVVVLELVEKLMGKDYVDNSDFLELACLASICDVVPLKGYTREIVSIGLERMKTTTNIGLETLRRNKVEDVEKISTYSCGFIIGPCLNASGRLETATLSVKLLLSETEDDASLYTTKLVGLNKDRQLLTDEGLEKAIELYDENRKIQFIILPSKYESVCGIIAGRLKELYNKPVLVCSYNENKKVYKGSGRSTDYFNMFEEIEKSKRFLVSFGGHEKAIGFAVLEEELDNFKQDIEYVQKDVNFDTRKVVKIESNLNMDFISESLVRNLETLAPFGTDNEKPLFMSICTLSKLRRVGSKNNVIQFTFKNKDKYFNGVSFKNVDEFDKYIISKYDMKTLDALYNDEINITVKVVYALELNEYRGKNYVKLIVESII